MPTKIVAPGKTVQVELLTPTAFAPFGTVIQHPSKTNFPTPLLAVEANQGSAIKYADVSPLISSYEMSKSTKPALPKISMFACKPRQLQQYSQGHKLFTVNILERHPFTPQTFVPIGLSPDDRDTAYLVIVAPTLPLSRTTQALRGAAQPPYPVPDRQQKPTLRQRILGGRPNPFTNDYRLTTTPASLPASSPINVSTATPKSPGPPDLANLRAFLVRGDQAVTYGAGTWHAPMVVVGKQNVDFVVAQYANGVTNEDCQEVVWDGTQVEVVLGLDLWVQQPRARL